MSSDTTAISKVNHAYIKTCLEKIVSSEHSNPIKQKVKVKANKGFQIACPYCGDSKKNPSNFRGNLNENLYYKCFNDGCDKKTHFTNLCKDFNINIDGKIKQAIYNELDNYTNKIDALEDELIDNGLKFLINLDDLKYELNLNPNNSLKLINFKPIQPKTRQYYYLVNERGLDPSNFDNIYQADYIVKEDWIEKGIVFLNRKNDKIIGMQYRNMKDGYKRKFHIYVFEDLFNFLNPNEYINDSQLMMYNKLSYYYGILNIDFNSKISIFEGYGDAILHPNSIGVVGVNTPVNFLENNNLNIRYFYDNDDAGNLKAEEKIKSGFPVFLWKKLFNDIIEKKKPSDPYYHFNKINKVNDLTNLNKLIKDSYNKLQLEKYYSKDKYDIKYIPHVERKNKSNYNNN